MISTNEIGYFECRIVALLKAIQAMLDTIMRPEAVTATVLWTMTAWAFEGATHSPILAAISVEPDSGKSTFLVFCVFWCRNRLSASNRPVPASVRLIANTRR